jgi:hypothetical protein
MHCCFVYALYIYMVRITRLASELIAGTIKIREILFCFLRVTFPLRCHIPKRKLTSNLEREIFDKILIIARINKSGITTYLGKLSKRRREKSTLDLSLPIHRILFIQNVTRSPQCIPCPIHCNVFFFWSTSSDFLYLLLLFLLSLYLLIFIDVVYDMIRASNLTSHDHLPLYNKN